MVCWSFRRRFVPWTPILFALVAGGGCGRLGYEALEIRPGSDAPDAPVQDAGPGPSFPSVDAPEPPTVDASPSLDQAPDAEQDAAPHFQTCPQWGSRAIFCEDFEHGLPTAADGPGYELLTNQHGAASLSSQAFAGTSSLKVTLQVPPRKTYADARLWFTLPPRRPQDLTYHVRSRIRVAAGMPVAEWLVLLELHAANTKFSLDVYDQDWMSLFPGEGQPGDPAQGIRLQRDRWICAEFQVHYPAAGETMGRIQLAVDGVKVLSRQVPRAAFPEFQRFAFGLIASEPRSLTEVFFDDVVVSHESVGCR